GEDQRCLDLRPECFGGEVGFERPVVDGDGAVAGPEEDAGGRCLAATGPVILHCCHVTRPHPLACPPTRAARRRMVSAPRADDPDRRTLSACGTSPRRFSSSAACRAPRPRSV